MDEFCGSTFWNSSQNWYLNKPILTKCFRELIFVWMPCALFWLLVPFQINYLKTSINRHIPWNRINIGKLIFNGLLLLLSLVDIIVASFLKIIMDNDFKNDIYPVDIWSGIIKFITFLLIFVFTILNRKFGIHTSGCQFLFWLILSILSICKIVGNGENVVKDNFWSKYKYTSFMIFLALSLCMLFINCFADKKPKESKFTSQANEIPERYASFLSRITYNWFDSMAWKGFRNPITTKDLWSLRPQELTSEVIRDFSKYAKPHHKNCFLSKSFQHVTEHGVEIVQLETRQSHPNIEKQYSSILPMIIKSFGGVFLFGSLMKLLTDLLTFVHPQILRLIIAYVETANTEEVPPKWLGVFYAILLFLTASIQTIVLCQYFHRMFIVGMHIRSALISTIFRKALSISNAARRQFTTGEIVNLMSVDVQRCMDLTTYLNMIWSAPLQIGLALYFLWQQLGPSVLAGFAVMILLIPINAAIASRMKSFQIKQMKFKDERVKLMNEILAGMKALKLNAWEENFENQVLKIREKEIATLKSTAYLNAITFLLMFCASVIVSLSTFATYVLIDENNVLDATKTFVSLSLFNVLSFPLSTLPVLITNTVQAQVSVKRINKFLNSSDLDISNVQHKSNEDYALLIESGNFVWDHSIKDGQESFEQQIPQLKDINIKIQKHSLCAIVGAVGVGKSSLIQAFLGEMGKQSGYVNSDGSIAYVPQQAWIQNASIRENILFGRSFDRIRYKRVLSACALNADIKMFSAGDLTEIGERGINLSGGQKQRISLARAVYSDADIYLLDDPLSAVDAHVGRHIFEHVIGPNGVLAKKTRVFVTHSITFLPRVNIIYVMSNGQISEIGSYQELLERRGAFSEFLQQYMNSSNIKEGEEEEEKVEINTTQHQSNNDIDAISLESLDAQVPKNNGKLIEAETFEEGNVRFTCYKHYIKGVGLLLSILTLLFILVFQIFQIGSNLWLAKWSNDKRLESDTSIRDMYLGVYGVFGFGQAICSFLATLVLSLGCVHCARKLHGNLLWNVMRWPMDIFDTTPVGRILNRFSKDIETVDNVLPQNWRMILMQAYALLATIIIISISTPIFLAVIIPVGIIYIFVQRVYVATSRQLIRLESVSRSPIYSHFSETLSGVSSIRAYGVQERFIEISDNRVDQNHVCQYPALIANRWLSIRLEMIGNFIIFFASLFAVLGGQTNAGLVGLSISYALQITDTLKWLVRLSSDIENNIVAVERIKEYSEFEQEAERYIESPKLAIDWPQTGAIVFENFQLRYRDDLDLVLRGISFIIKSGQKVGIVGRTGAGKSSLTLSLFRIIESAGGRILIDNVDISTIGLHQLRSRLTILPQDPILFSGSLRSNIDPSHTKNDEEIWQALSLSHMKRFVESLPTGLNHHISEGGENLSVGQRQLICLARALLRKSKIIILDEATAAIDLETDELIQQTIRTQFHDCTVIAIAHRLNTILDYDAIIVFEKGEVAEIGAPAKLLKNSESLFYSMAKDANII